MSKLKLLVAPTETPVSVTEAKEYLRVDGNAEDLRINLMIQAAVKRLEEFADTRFIYQTWVQYNDGWPVDTVNEWWDGVREIPISELSKPGKYIELLTGPVVQVTEFNTYADDGVAQLNPPNNYIVDTVGRFGRIALPMGGVWPTTILRKINGIEIKFVCGQAPNAATCPADIKQAILEMVAHLYEHRGDEKQVEIPSAVGFLLSQYRTQRLGLRGI